MAEPGELLNGIPNEDSLPHLHVLCHSRNYALDRLPQMPKSALKDIKEHSQTLKEAKDKILAVLTLILDGDKTAALYMLVSLISRVYSRDAGMLIGNVAANLSNVTSEQATLI